MSTPTQRLLSLLNLEEIGENRFTAHAPETTVQRVFGGQVAAQSLMAAMRTVDEDRQVHSLHSSFFHHGDPTIPIIFEVDRVRDGRAFSNRVVTAYQEDRPIFMMITGFHIQEPGPEHQITRPVVPWPDEVADVLPDMVKRGVPWLADQFPGSEAIKVNLVQPLDVQAAVQANTLQLWFKSAEPINGDMRLHACFLTFASDMALLIPAVLPHMPTPTTRYQLASLNHSIWFQRPVKFDDWLLYNMRSCRAAGARGTAQGHVYTRDGELVATITQEGLIRPQGDTGQMATGLDHKGRLINP
ncbi:acyl-CoA thioesterase II [Stomatohabitans albus]|uniref:acyl-CoA thioesterase n=1 Tax=Stomatohabitans albus TaxID=3110766 RepID=UPI00300CAA0E